jgi:hypothetical protein
MSLTKDRHTPYRDGTHVQLPVKAGVHIFAGSLVVQKGGLIMPGRTATGLHCLGRAERAVDNTLGQDGDFAVLIKSGVAFKFDNALGDEIDPSHIGATCFIVDDATVALTDGNGTRSPAGRVIDVDDDGVWVKIP